MNKFVCLITIFVLATLAFTADTTEEQQKCQNAAKQFFKKAYDSKDFDERKELLNQLGRECKDLSKKENGTQMVHQAIKSEAVGKKEECAQKVSRVVKKLHGVGEKELTKERELELVDKIMTYCFTETKGKEGSSTKSNSNSNNSNKSNDEKMELLEKEQEAQAALDYEKNKNKNEESKSESTSSEDSSDSVTEEEKEEENKAFVEGQGTTSTQGTNNSGTGNSETKEEKKEEDKAFITQAISSGTGNDENKGSGSNSSGSGSGSDSKPVIDQNEEEDKKESSEEDKIEDKEEQAVEDNGTSTQTPHAEKTRRLLMAH